MTISIEVLQPKTAQPPKTLLYLNPAFSNGTYNGPLGKQSVSGLFRCSLHDFNHLIDLHLGDLLA
jgi:hypothetical protein